MHALGKALKPQVGFKQANASIVRRGQMDAPETLRRLLLDFSWCRQSIPLRCKYIFENHLPIWALALLFKPGFCP